METGKSIPEGLSSATGFAPAGRDGWEELQRRRAVIEQTPLLQQTIDAISDIVLILNQHRQIVGANAALVELFGCQVDDVIGKRPGELVGCERVGDGPDGCGTAPDCRVCGAVNAVLECQERHQRVARECRISIREPVGSSLDLHVQASIVQAADEEFTICVLKDISDKQRLAVLARLFFHDLMNTAGGIQGFAHLLRERVMDRSDEAEDLAELESLADHLVDEIQSQRELTFAESGDLEPEFKPVKTVELLEELRNLYRQHPVARERTITIRNVWQGSLITDRRLLGRVIGNMIKNALEATEPGGCVTVDCHEQDRNVVFQVHNASVMPPEVQMQVFQRSFSTKSEQGRGIGTHSMKLLGERYLGGEVRFTSQTPEGTTFSITLPKVKLHRETE